MDPVRPDTGAVEVVFSAEGCADLPAALHDVEGGMVGIVTRWRLTPEERAALAAGTEDVHLVILTRPSRRITMPPVLLQVGPGDFVVPPEQYESACVGCGCSDSHACPGGCGWVWVRRPLRLGLCTACLAKGIDATEPGKGEQPACATCGAPLGVDTARPGGCSGCSPTAEDLRRAEQVDAEMDVPEGMDEWLVEEIRAEQEGG